MTEIPVLVGPVVIYYRPDYERKNWLKCKYIKLKQCIIMKLIGNTPVVANLSLPTPILFDHVEGAIMMNCCAAPYNTIVRTKWESEI